MSRDCLLGIGVFTHFEITSSFRTATTLVFNTVLKLLINHLLESDFFGRDINQLGHTERGTPEACGGFSNATVICTSAAMSKQKVENMWSLMCLNSFELVGRLSLQQAEIRSGKESVACRHDTGWRMLHHSYILCDRPQPGETKAICSRMKYEHINKYSNK